ncbi:headcase protein isoform X2 [Drosophila busckii]|uniref:headcase protein isoform X2 n=1 Tax=Drosophila busckii TaxID=30019 RepID=UPI00083EB575|nr:headcase protein isoform X2 [Drosophila busckii]
MAPRRNSSANSPQHQQQQQQQHQTQQQSAQQQHQQIFMAPMQQTLNVGVQLTRCCYPNGECGKLDALIALDEQGVAECVRVLCNNENCNMGQYMHRDCFDQWEASVLQQLKASGRARSWSERQRVQQLWTKKGYDLIYKNCSCKCGRGQLRKDLEWPPNQICFAAAARSAAGNLSSEDEDKKKAKKKRNRNQKQNVALTPLNSNCSNLTPNPNVGVIGSGLNHSSNNNNGNSLNNGNNNSLGLQASVVATLSNILMSSNNNVLGLDLRTRAGSLSSSGSSSPSASQSSADISLSPVQQQQQLHLQQHQQQQQQQQQLQLPASISNSLLNGLGQQPKSLLPVQAPPQPPQLPALANISNFKPLASYDQQQLVQQQKNKEVELYSERVRSTSGCNGIFSRRLDFSSFNMLPKTRLNSYQVKVSSHDSARTTNCCEYIGAIETIRLTCIYRYLYIV